MNFFNKLTSGGELPVEAAAAKAAATQSLGRFNCYADSLLLAVTGPSAPTTWCRRGAVPRERGVRRELAVCFKTTRQDNRRSAILGGSHHSDKYGN